uniref:Smr domain-containing protein n=1 Tax=Picocystis salinarum TaxID=88271 RepID=A0A7S3XET9_9CHLO|mmetsp:Transcript_10601/g.65381  ORF Transcript_10601/g.65381 Transcript_10601/m.65381 type:complete len:703 (-) Transcript_10601:574-2682(-)
MKFVLEGNLAASLLLYGITATCTPLFHDQDISFRQLVGGVTRTLLLRPNPLTFTMREFHVPCHVETPCSCSNSMDVSTTFTFHGASDTVGSTTHPPIASLNEAAEGMERMRRVAMRIAVFPIARALSGATEAWKPAKGSLNLPRLRKAVLEAPLGSGQVQKLVREAVRSGFRRPQGLTMLLSLCATRKQSQRALELFRAAQAEGMQINTFTYNALLHVLIKGGTPKEAEAVYKEMLERGLSPSNHTYGAMIAIMDATRRPDKALQLLHECNQVVKEPNLILYNKTLSALANSKWWKESLQILDEMKEKGIQPDNVSVLYITRALARCPDDWTVGRTLQNLERYASDAGTYSSLMSYYARAGKWESIIELHGRMEEKNIRLTTRVYNNIVVAYGKCGKLDKALNYFNQLKDSGQTPDAVLFSSLIDCFGKAKQWEKSVQYFEELVLAGHKPNVLHYTALISSLEKGLQWQKALDTFQKMKDAGVQPNLITYNALISACDKGGQTDKAFLIFDELLSQGLAPDTISYSALICACEKQGKWRAALRLYVDMQKRGVEPNGYTYRSLLDILVKAGQIQTATEVHRDAYRRGIFCHFDMDTEKLGQIDLHKASSAGAIAVLVSWLRGIKRSHMVGKSFPEPEALIITGWGRRSEELGQSKVREAVIDFLNNSSKQPLPFKTPGYNRGRFLVDANILRDWIMKDARLT